MEHLSGARFIDYIRWRKDWVNIANELVPGQSKSERLHALSLMLAQPAPGECRHKYKQESTAKGPSSCLLVAVFIGK